MLFNLISFNDQAKAKWEEIEMKKRQIVLS